MHRRTNDHGWTSYKAPVFLLFLPILNLFAGVIGFTCPRLCSCPHEGAVNCSYRNITDILYHTHWDPDTLHLNLQGNQIETLDLTLLSPFRGMQLRTLDLSSNPLKTITVHAQSTTSVHTLILNKCALESLPAALFQGNIGRFLKVLRLSGNNQTLILEDYLMRDANLRVVVLETNDLISTEFTKLASIESLFLGGNPIGDDVWDIGLYISRVTYLYLNNIGLTKLSLTVNINGLKALSVADNQITVINTDLLLHGESIHSLNLRNNLLASLPDKFSQNLPDLRVLDLGMNQLRIFRMIWIQDLNLTDLYLDHNHIQAMPSGPEIAIQKLSNLKFLMLNRNSLHCNCELQWFRKWMAKLGDNDTKVNKNSYIENLSFLFCHLRWYHEYFPLKSTVISILNSMLG